MTKEDTDEAEQEEEERLLEEEARALRHGLEELLHGRMDVWQAHLVLLISQYSDEALERALLMTFDTNSSEQSFSGRLPLHVACECNAPIELIQWLLDNDKTQKSYLQGDKWGDLPIHTVCSRRDSLPVVKLLLESDVDKHTILTKDHHGALPLHIAIRYNAPPSVMELLLENDVATKSLYSKETYGQLPIHVAARCNSAPPIVRILLDRDLSKESVLQPDNVGRLPLHVALLRNPNPEAIQLLLEAMICHRLEQVGLLNWKHCLEKMMHLLRTPERDFLTRDNLDSTVQALEGFLERAVLLELVVWKAACLDHGRFQSMEEIKEPELDQYKTERRIKSGAEIILPGVLSFLEDEPVVELVKEIESSRK